MPDFDKSLDMITCEDFAEKLALCRLSDLQNRFDYARIVTKTKKSVLSVLVKGIMARVRSSLRNLGALVVRFKDQIRHFDNALN